MSNRIIVAVAYSAISLSPLNGDIFKVITNHDTESLAALTNQSAIVNSRNANDETPLMLAARLGEVESVKILIAAGAKVDALNHGLGVVEQIESYLQRTGDSRSQILSFLRTDGFSEETIRAFERETDKLQGTSERIKAWQDILRILSERKDKLSKVVTPLSLECALSIWVKEFTWTKDEGFTLAFRSKNRPLLQVRNDRVRVRAKERVCLKRGEKYTLTDNRGHIQTYEVCSPDVLNFVVPMSFRSEKEVLLLKHSEPLVEDEGMRIEEYVVTRFGDVYDVASRSQYRRKMPMLAPKPLLLSDAQKRQRALTDAAWVLKTALKERMCAQQVVMRKSLPNPSRNGITNNVCYLMADSKSAKWGMLKWAQVVSEGGPPHVCGITEHFAGKGQRQIRFYPSGSVKEWTEEIKASNRRFVCHYDEMGALMWQIKMRDNKAFEFWRVENGRIEESPDLALAQKLAEQATIEDVE